MPNVSHFRRRSVFAADNPITCTLYGVIAGLAAEMVQGVACGFGHSIALTGAGHLFSWGWNREGQLGVGDRAPRAQECQPGRDVGG